MRALYLAVLGSIAALAGCGPACIDDRCSLTPAQPQVTKVDYVNPPKPDTGSDTGSAAPLVAAGSGSGSATPPATGSATPPPAVGSGSAAPPPVVATPPAESVSWGALNDSFKQYVTTKAAVAQGTVVKLEFVKTPEKTPFVVTLETKPATEPLGAEAVWNDCPQDKIRCDATGTKSHAVKRAGNVLIKAGVNWSVTSVTDDGKGTLATWTNNLSRETLQLRLVK
jgi:hypothetical protein